MDPTMIPVELSRIVINESNDEQVIFLKEKAGSRSFPIVIGIFEAAAIDRIIKERQTPRPLTHDLIGGVVRALGGRIVRIMIDEIRGDTYYAKIILMHDTEELAVDARPSDAITLALQASAPILVSEPVMNAVCPTEA